MSWTCPNCGRQFARTRQAHVCGQWTVEQHLADADERSLQLFERFVGIVGSAGSFEYAPTARQVGIRGSRRIFAGLRLTEHGLEGYLDLPRRVNSPRFRHVAPYTKKLSVHHFVLEDEGELDEEFSDWIREAYAVGEGLV